MDSNRKNQKKRDRKIQNKVLGSYSYNVEYATCRKIIFGYCIFSTMVCAGYVTYSVLKGGLNNLLSLIMDCAIVWVVALIAVSLIAYILTEIYLKFIIDKEKESLRFLDYEWNMLTTMVEENTITESEKFRYYLFATMSTYNIDIEDLEYERVHKNKFKKKQKVNRTSAPKSGVDQRLRRTQQFKTK